MPSTYSAISQIGNVETFITKLQKVLLTLVCLLRKKKKTKPRIQFMGRCKLQLK